MTFKQRMHKPGHQSGSEPRLAVTAFGKHPGWDDHIDDIELETALLAETKRWLYVEGIRAIVDNGIWEKLADDQVLSEFDHLFLWRVGNDIVLGRLWSSRDGKGRSRYPMVLCMHGRNVSQQWMFDHAWPAMEAMRNACSETTSASDVQGIIDEYRAKLRTDAEQQPEVALDEEDDPKALAQLFDDPEFHSGSGLQSGDNAAMHRALYQIDRDMAAFRPVGNGRARSTDKPSGEISLRAQHIRVSTGALKPVDAITSWLSVIAAEVSKQTPMLVLYPLDVQQPNWCDIVVGSPTEATLKCLRTAPKGLPLATSIPYTIEPDFAASVDQAIEASRSGQRPDSSVHQADAHKADPVPTSQPPQADPPSSDPRKPATTQSRSSGGTVFLIIITLLAALGIAGYFFMQGQEAPLDEPRVDPVETVQTADKYWASAIYEPDQRAALIAALQSDVELPGVPEFAAALREAEQAVLDPSMMDEQLTADAILAAQNRIRNAAKAWVDSVMEHADALERRRWQHAAHELREPARIVTTLLNARQLDDPRDSHDFISAVRSAVAANSAIIVLEQQREEILHHAHAIVDRVAEYESALLATLPDRIDSHLAAAHDLQDLQSRMDEAEAVTKALSDTIDLHWDQLASSDFVQESDVKIDADRGDLDSFTAWAEAVHRSEPAMQEVSSDPREDEQFVRAIDVLNERIRELSRCGSLSDELAIRRDDLRAEHEQAMALNWDGSSETRQQLQQRVSSITQMAHDLEAEVIRAIDLCMQECESHLAQILEQRDQFQSAQLNTAWNQQRDAVMETDAGCQQQLEELNVFRESLERLENAAPSPDLKQWRLGSAEPAMVQDIILHHRDAALSRALEQSNPQATLTQYSQWLADVQQLFERYDDIEHRLDELAGLRDIEQLYGQVRDAEVHDSISAVVEAIDERVEGLISISHAPVERQVDREQLVQFIEQGDRPLEQRFHAWVRLGQGEADDPRVLEFEQRSLSALDSDLQNIGGRGEQVLADMRNEQRHRWIAHVETIDTKAAMAEAIHTHHRFGINRDDEDLETYLQFNINLRLIRRAIERAIEADDAAAALRYLGSVKAMAGSLRNDLPGHVDDVDALLREIERIETINESPEPDFSRIGPGVAGWRGEVSEDATTIRFTPPESWQRTGEEGLIFRRVSPTDAPTAYLATTEVHVGLFLDAAEHRDDWSYIRQLFPRTHSPDGRVMRRGPRTWDWRDVNNADSPMRIASQWLRDEHESSYADSVQVVNPDERHPMQQLSAAAAMHVASLLGCRLPTYREWHAAYVSSGSEQQVSDANLRRSAWSAQRKHFETMGRMRVERPDEGSHVVAGMELSDSWSDSAPDTDWLWFRPVTASERFSDLVGNVAEYIFNEPERILAKVQDVSVGGRVLELSDRDLDDLYIVGASSMTPPTIAPDQLQPVPRPANVRTFSDVGFRLAFSAEMIEEAVLDQQQLLARFVQETGYYLVPDR